MPSSPRKRVNGNKEGMSRGTKKSDSDSEDSDLPSLIPCTDDEDSEEEEYLKKPTSKVKGKGKDSAAAKPKTNGECVDKWYKLSKDEKEKNIHIMKIYLLSPFLFGQVYQDDKWINWAYECGLLPSKSSFEIRDLKEEHFDAVDLVETACSKLVENVLWKNKDGLLKTLETITKVNMSQHLDKAVTCAESFLSFTSVRDKIKVKAGMSKKQGDMALLFAQYQVCEHVKQMAKGVNLVEDFKKRCNDEEAQTADKKKEGNDAFSTGKYTAAISTYSRALHVSPYNHVLYGNRAQSYLKTKDFRCALADGRRAITLKADWHKAQYRYCQAFIELGFYSRAKEVNRAAKKICSEKKDLDSQYDKLMKSTLTTSDSKGKMAEKTKTSKTAVGGRKSSNESDIEDLPALVDPDSSDTSKSDDDMPGDDEMPGLVELESPEESDYSVNSESEGAPVSHHSESSDGSDSDDSTARRKKAVASLEHRKKKQEKKLRERKELERARIEEIKKRRAELAAAKIREHKKLEKKIKNNKATQKEQSVEVQRKREMTAWLKQGGKAIEEKKSVMAVHSYGEALKIVEQYSYQILEMKEIDFVILLYSHGTACLLTGIHEELQVAMKQFEIIVVQHKDVDFPLAYYGVGSVFYKQNRFTEALEPLEKGLSLVNKLGDELGVYRWPGSTVIIDETKRGRLLSTFETLIRVCRHPPRPDAVCRYSDCLSKTQIYLTDPDYKGFIRLICHENCKVDFHPVCWKKLKSAEDEKAGDKDFIDDECMTPDCSGSVTNIQIFDAEGLKTEFKCEKPNAKPEAKAKPAKQTKVKLSGAAAKQKKKREKEEAKADQAGPAETAPTDSSEEKQHVKNSSLSAAQREEKPSEGENTHMEKRGYDPFNADVGIPPADDGVYILRKESEEDPLKGAVFKGLGKAKSKKKKAKNTQTQTLDEFLKDHGGQQSSFRPGSDGINDVDEIPPPKCKFDLVPPPPGWSQHEMEAPFAVPPHLQGQAADFEADYQAMNMFPFSSVSESQPQVNLKAVTDYVGSMLQEILRVNGPLDLADPKIMQPLSLLPDNYQEIISQTGGLKPILEQSAKFVFDGNKVMLPEDKEFEDIVQTLRPSSRETKNPFLERERTVNDTDSGLGKDPLGVKQNGVCNTRIASESIWDIDGVVERNDVDPESSDLSSSLLSSLSPRFNPMAKEFVQTLSSSSSDTSLTPVIESTCGDIEAVDDQIIECVSSNSQPDSYVNKTNDSTPVAGADDTIVTTRTGQSADICTENVLAPGSGANDKSSEDSCSDPGELSSFVVSAQTDFTSVSKDVFSQTQNLQKPNSSEPVISSKTKAVQTQPNVKSKGVGTDPIPEPFKAEYLRAAAEKESLQNRLQEANERHAVIVNKNSAECDKLKKKLTEVQQEKEKHFKEVQEIKQKNLEEIRKLKQQCEDKDDKIKTLTQKLQDAEEKSVIVGSLKKEVVSCKALFTAEKESWMKERSEKDDLLKNIKLQHQQQQTRAQEAEVKLLELRRDVGLRFLERAYQESHITINNLIQAVNARVAGPKVEELINTWKSYAAECHQRVLQCKTTFNEQIELLKAGRNLSSVPQLPIPGPPPYPAIPVLQSVVPGQPQSQSQPQPQPQPLSQTQSQPPADSNSTSRPSEPSRPVVTAAGPAATTAATPSTSAAPSAVVPPTGSNASTNGEAPPGTGSVAPSAAAATTAAAAASTAAAAAAAADKGRPSNSYEKIMLRLSTMYPTFSRLELTGFIKEVRHNKHGSLTGLSLEDIVSSISELVEQKRKAGLLRPAPTAPVGRLNNNSPVPRPTVPPAGKPTQMQQPTQPGVKAAAAQAEGGKVAYGHYEEDPCVICHEDMNTSIDIVTLECTHRYHSPCVRKWLLGEQSTCPTCHVHALLPDEFPRLK